MAIVTGLLVFNINRTGIIDPVLDSGTSNIPIVLQNTATLMTLAAYTDDSGEYKFQNVPIGDYRVVIASDYSRLVLDSPADFAKNATQATEIQSSTLPSYIIVDPDIVANGMNALNAVEPTTLNLSIRDNSVYLSDFF